MKGPMITEQLPINSLIAVLVAMMVLTAVAGHLYLIKPPLKALADNQGTLFDTRRAHPLGEPPTQRIKDLETEIAQLKERLSGKAPMLSANEMVAFVIGRLDSIARAQNVQLVSVEPGMVERVFEFDEIPFHIEVVGGYLHIVDWLQQAENELGPMVIKSFELAPAADDNSRRMRLTMVSYRSAGDSV